MIGEYSALVAAGSLSFEEALMLVRRRGVLMEEAVPAGQGTMAAVLGGTQSLHTNSRDEAYATPTKDSVTIALRTQQVIAHESGVTDIVDPLAGSFALEKLTDDIEAKALEYIEKIDSMGGAIKAIESGFMQNEILNSAYTYQKAIENQNLIIVGLNEFVTEEESLRDVLKIDPEVERYQREKLARVKAKRDLSRIKRTLGALKEAAEGNGNIVPPVSDAVRAYATVGEISDTLRDVFGEYRES